MPDPVRELKARASIIHSRVTRGDGDALARLRVLPELRSATDQELLAASPSIQLRQCLSVLAIEFGFSGWQHASAVLTGGPVEDFGTTLYPNAARGHFNAWYRDYEEARKHRAEAGGFLLAYKRDLFVAEASFIESLGLDPDAPEWKLMGYDWPRPLDVAARTRLYGVLVSLRPREHAFEIPNSHGP